MRIATLAIALFLVARLAAEPASAAPQGTVVLATPYSYQGLIERLEQAVAAHDLGVVTRASATLGVKAVLGEDIPGNMVIGVYHPRFAKRMLEASIPAGIEAPLRFYVTEEADGTASLRYRKPSAVFAPYDDPSGRLTLLARELDGLFSKIAEQATAAQ